MNARCAQRSRECHGEVAFYSFDLDLPNLALCEAHVWLMFADAPDYVRMQVAEEMEGLGGD